MASLASYYERQKPCTSNIRNALTYPAYPARHALAILFPIARDTGHAGV